MLYVHFPYCAHHCAYCDFNVVTPRAIPVERYTDAVIAELGARADGLSAASQTLYIGGGTPSLWAPRQLDRLLDAVRERPGLASDAEITIEANPDDVSRELLARWRAQGITRVSLGVQALRDDLLRAADRRHDAQTALRACEQVAAAGLASWTFDLMFGLPGQTVAGWEEDLSLAVALGSPHLSVYALTVEPRTRLEWQLRRGDVALPGDEVQTEMMLRARQTLTAAGYGHYEVSSYATPGHRAVHNGGYWQMASYLGLGAGAHGFISPRRWVNVRRPSRYIDAALAGDATASDEHLDADTLAFERVMTGLRDLETGVDIGFAGERFDDAVAAELERGRLSRDATRIRLTDTGLLWMNDVLLNLLG